MLIQKVDPKDSAKVLRHLADTCGQILDCLQSVLKEIILSY